jgi:hypothetical protein
MKKVNLLEKPTTKFSLKEELKDLNVRKKSVVKNMEVQTDMKMETINQFE